MDDKMRFKIAHHAKNYIDLDTTKEEDSSTSSAEDMGNATNDPNSIFKKLA